jgi:hypothetical protein
VKRPTITRPNRDRNMSIEHVCENTSHCRWPQTSTQSHCFLQACSAATPTERLGGGVQSGLGQGWLLDNPRGRHKKPNP